MVRESTWIFWAESVKSEKKVNKKEVKEYVLDFSSNDNIIKEEENNYNYQPTETKETIGNKENAKMLFLWSFVSVLFPVVY